jgi:hypothetical protein
VHKPHDRGEKDVLHLREKPRPQRAITFGDGNQDLVKGLGKIAISPDHSISNVFLVDSLDLKGKWALGPFLSVLVIECQHKCLSVNLCQLMDKVQIKSKGMFLRLSTLF